MQRPHDAGEYAQRNGFLQHALDLEIAHGRAQRRTWLRRYEYQPRAKFLLQEPGHIDAAFRASQTPVADGDFRRTLSGQRPGLGGRRRSTGLITESREVAGACFERRFIVFNDQNIGQRC